MAVYANTSAFLDESGYLFAWALGSANTFHCFAWFARFTGSVFRAVRSLAPFFISAYQSSLVNFHRTCLVLDLVHEFIFTPVRLQLRQPYHCWVLC